jgi:hypothetical protein
VGVYQECGLLDGGGGGTTDKEKSGAIFVGKGMQDDESSDADEEDVEKNVEKVFSALSAVTRMLNKK